MAKKKSKSKIKINKLSKDAMKAGERRGSKIGKDLRKSMK